MWSETQLSWHFSRMKCAIHSIESEHELKVWTSRTEKWSQAHDNSSESPCPRRVWLLLTSSWVCVQWHYFIMRNPFRNVIVIHWDDVESSSGRGGVVTIIKWKTQFTTSQYYPSDCTSRGRAGRHSQCRICWTRNGFALLSHLLYTLCSNEIFCTCTIGWEEASERERRKSSKISPSLFGR